MMRWLLDKPIDSFQLAKKTFSFYAIIRNVFD